MYAKTTIQSTSTQTQNNPTTYRNHRLSLPQLKTRGHSPMERDCNPEETVFQYKFQGNSHTQNCRKFVLSMAYGNHPR